MLDTRNIIDDMRGLDTDRIKMILSNKTLPYVVLINNVKGCLNTGVMIRNSNFYGASKVFYYGDRHWNRVPSVGTYNYTTVEYLRSIDLLKELKSKYNFVGVEIGQQNKRFELKNYIPKSNNMYIFGNETVGIDDEVLSLCDQFLEISSNKRSVRSLNVSVCSGIVLNHHYEHAS